MSVTTTTAGCKLVLDERSQFLIRLKQLKTGTFMFDAPQHALSIRVSSSCPERAWYTTRSLLNL
jgi:hypothetical protein